MRQWHHSTVPLTKLKSKMTCSLGDKKNQSNPRISSSEGTFLRPFNNSLLVVLLLDLLPTYLEVNTCNFVPRCLRDFFFVRSCSKQKWINLRQHKNIQNLHWDLIPLGKAKICRRNARSKSFPLIANGLMLI